MATNRLPAFEKFIQDIRAAWAALPDTETRMGKTAELLKTLVADQTMRAHCKNWPSTDGHKNLLLYEDPDYGFAINAVVRVAGAQGRAHDHAHSWTAYGVLDGQEKMERFRAIEDRRKEARQLFDVCRCVGNVSIPTRANRVVIRCMCVHGW